MPLKTKVILCANKERCRYYYEKEIEKQKSEINTYHGPSMRIKLNNNITILFYTPDNFFPNLIGVKNISEFEEKGAVYKHPRYNEAVRYIRSKIL